MFCHKAYILGQFPSIEHMRRYNMGGAMKVHIAVAEAPIRFKIALKLGIDSAMKRPASTITLLNRHLFQ